MKILKAQLEADLQAKKLVKLNLGSGPFRKEGFYSVDLIELPEIDLQADLNEPLTLLPDNSVAEIYTRHSLEHVTNFLELMREIYRISTANSRIEIIVPHFSNVYGFSDPTHVRFFGLFSFFYFCSQTNQPSLRKVPAFYTDVRFCVHSIKIEFYTHTFLEKVLNKLFLKLVNSSLRNQYVYEKWFSRIFQAWQITYILQPDK